jgi:hypothetical protein
MATQPTTAPRETSALVPVAAAIEFNLDAFPTASFNRLSPIQTIRMPSDLFVPIVQVVQLDPADREGKSADHYKSNDVPGGHRALTARGLNKVATAGSVSFFDERRADDGSDPNVIGVTIMASMALPTGQRITAPGSQLIDIRTWFGPSTSAAEIAKFRKQFFAHVSTRAKNRAIRGLLSLRSSYPDADIAKPFAVVSYAPNMNHPEVRARFLDAMAPAVAQLYGPTAVPQLTAGQVIRLPEAPEDDEPIEGQAQEAGEPSWFDAAAQTQPAPAAPVGPSPTEHLVTILREAADRSGIVGAASETQKVELRRIFTPLGLDATATGLRIVYGLASLSDITGAQAQALINVAVAAEFPDLWRELVAGEAAAA